jgi:phosphohistidine phosphatase
LWLLRHAKTRREPPPGGSDHERQLSPRGQKDATKLGERLGDRGDHLGLTLDELPGLVLCSTATRSVQTVERALAGMASPPPVKYEHALYEASPQELLDQVHRVDDDVPTVMVVGHNPTFEDLALGLLHKGDKRGREELGSKGFPTCAVGVFDLDGDRWRQAALGAATLGGLYAPPF